MVFISMCLDRPWNWGLWVIAIADWLSSRMVTCWFLVFVSLDISCFSWRDSCAAGDCAIYSASAVDKATRASYFARTQLHHSAWRHSQRYFLSFMSPTQLASEYSTSLFESSLSLYDSTPSSAGSQLWLRMQWPFLSVPLSHSQFYWNLWCCLPLPLWGHWVGCTTVQIHTGFFPVCTSGCFCLVAMFRSSQFQFPYHWVSTTLCACLNLCTFM